MLKNRKIYFSALAVFLISAAIVIITALNGKHDSAIASTNIVNPVYGGTEDGKWEGDRVYFGTYEQDNDLENGSEPILWRVLQISDDEIMLLSEYGLDAKAYHSNFENITWKDCSLRAWLNEQFLKKAFSPAEQTAITEHYNKACSNPYYGTDAGEDTVDKVFLLSWDEVCNQEYGFQGPVAATTPSGEEAYYSQVSDTRTCIATAYATANRALVTRKVSSATDSNGNKFTADMTGYWCIRTPHKDQRFISYVSRWGRTTINFRSPVDHVTAVIRPAIVLDRRQISFTYEDSLEYSIIHCLSNDNEVAVLKDILQNPCYGGTKDGKWQGDKVYFGSYEQDAKADNGAEPVLWRVLNVQGNKALLLSEYGLERKKYNKTRDDITWEECALREWMNTTLRKKLFSKEEREAILETNLEACDNPRYKVSAGNDTTDFIFALSWNDVLNPNYGFQKGEYNQDGDFLYGGYSDTRTCKPTAYAKEKVFTDLPFEVYDAKNNAFDIEGNGYWWLRTPGFYQTYAVDVDSFGDIYYHELLRTTNRNVMARPALWVDLDKLSIISYTEDGLMQIGIK